MAKKKKFSAKDIGGELLPVITRGLYRDPLDTLREYLQNAIDAKAKHVELVVSADLISVRDDAEGMTRQVAEGAIRLGMSEKDPNRDVGFRGIGVYSAFNICNRLEIYTRAENDERTKLVFDFAKIREQLSEEEERRMSGEVSQLYLQKLLSESVWVEECEDCPLEKHGTLVVMVGIRGNVYKRLLDRFAVVEYLQSVVPLPFYPRFEHKRQIENKFDEEDYRVIDLQLSIDGRSEKIHRPYRNYMFTHRKGFGPRFFKVKNKLGKGNLGFAWVCLNDARKYLPEKCLRGLLVKKFGFSVGGRDQFAKFFSRAVFNNRVTGEIVIKHNDLIPNAARTEFEPGRIRDSLYMGFSELASGISTWANKIQDELKAKEELQTISPVVFSIVKKIPANERDVSELLRLNTVLTLYEKTLITHKSNLERTQKDLFDRTISALREAKKTIEHILSEKRRAKGRRQRKVKAGKVQVGAPRKEELVHAKDKPKNLMDVALLMDMELNKNVQVLLEYIDNEILRQKLTEGEYLQFLDDLTGYLEETL
jgi:hypothetical protein